MGCLDRVLYVTLAMLMGECLVHWESNSGQVMQAIMVFYFKHDLLFLLLSLSLLEG